MAAGGGGVKKVYLAARYSRREELCQYREHLRLAGVEVVGRWLDGGNQIDEVGKPIGDHGEQLVEGDAACREAAELRMKFAKDDVDDVAAADIVVSFTEQPRQASNNRGGRHVEFGYALATGKKLFIVGPRENLFHWLVPDPQVFGWWSHETLAAILGAALGPDREAA